MKNEKAINKITSHLTEKEKQELYKTARTNSQYNEIWQSVGKCVFCDLKDKYILHEENEIVLTINIYPYIDGQLMAIPRRHVKSTNELTALEWETMRKFGYIAKKLFKKIHDHKAMWSLVKTGIEAQGTVADHLHMHFIPFDNIDLNTWNYRELKYTPLENVDLYKKNVKEFTEAFIKFDKKYHKKDTKSVVVDLLIIHKNKILMQKRREEYKFDPDIYTLPGGHLNEEDLNLIAALAREVKEEINYDISSDNLELINSELSSLKYRTKILKKYNLLRKNTFIWNTYLLKKFDESQKLKPMDDCEKIIWIDIKDIENHRFISPEMKILILNATNK